MNTILQKRIEEAAREIGKRFPRHSQAVEYGCLFMSDWVLYHQWISVEEALPNEDKLYLIRNIRDKQRPDFVYCCQYSTKNENFYQEFRSDRFIYEATHWMEIPSLEGGEK